MTIIDITHKAASPSGTAQRTPWIDLPVCPKANYRIALNADLEKGHAIPAEGIFTWLNEIQHQGARLQTLNIGGPGDPLASPELTMELASELSRRYPHSQIQISTIGLHASRYAKALAEAGVKSVSLLVDAVSPEIAEKIYAWIRPAKKTLPLKQVVETLLSEQEAALKAFLEAGLQITVTTTVYPGYNNAHIEQIAKTMAAYGANTMTLVPCSPAAVTPDSKTPLQADSKIMQDSLALASRHIANITVYEKKSSDIGMECSSPAGHCVRQAALLPKPSAERPNIAVVSSNGMEIDLHLGQAYQVLIYGPREDGLACLLETRPAPEPGSGSSRWEELAQTLKDCFALLTASAGETPRKILAQHGITVLINDGEIEGTADVLFGGGKKCKK